MVNLLIWVVNVAFVLLLQMVKVVSIDDIINKYATGMNVAIHV